MKTTFYLLAILGGLTLGSASAADQPAARVEVAFVHPENFTDVKDDVFGSDRGRDYVLGQLKDHIEKTASKLLAEGQHLAIKVTDVDLAGAYEPQRGPQFDGVRFMRDIYPPRMELEFKVTDAGGKVVSEGKRHLLQSSYLMTSPPDVTNDPLHYDKEMINDWLRNEFGSGHKKS